MPSVYSDYVEDGTYPCLPKAVADGLQADYYTRQRRHVKWTVKREEAFMQATSAAPHFVRTEADDRSHETFIQRSGGDLNPELPDWFKALHKSVYP